MSEWERVRQDDPLFVPLFWLLPSADTFILFTFTFFGSLMTNVLPSADTFILFTFTLFGSLKTNVLPSADTFILYNFSFFGSLLTPQSRKSQLIVKI